MRRQILFPLRLLIVLFALLSVSCTAHKKIPYMLDADEITSEAFAKAAKIYEATVMPQDILSIKIKTASGTGTEIFNSSLVAETREESLLQGYLVDGEGNIEFPVIGKIKIGGLNKSEAQEKITKLIYPKYLKEEPITYIRYMNYRVTILGEVQKPGIYSSPTEQMTLLDAIASAGDLTIHGRRDNVTLIREDETGKRATYRINLQDENLLLNNDIYYLQQNDKIYVSPNKTKGNNAAIGAIESIALSALSVIITLVSIITR